MKRVLAILPLLTRCGVALVFASLLGITKTQAQYAMALDKGVADSVLGSCTDGSNLYVLYNIRNNHSGSYSDSFRVSKWNGIFWSDFKDIAGYSYVPAAGAYYRPSLLWHKGELYVCNIQNSYNNGHNLLKWDGSSWIPVGKSSPVAQEMISYNNKLFVTGQFSTAGGTAARGIAAWTGIGWDSVTGSPRLAPIEHLSDLTLFNNKILMLRHDYNGYGDSVIFTWNDTAWGEIIAPMAYVASLGTYKKKLVVSGLDYYGYQTVVMWDGYNWSKAVNGLDTGLGISFSLTEFNSKLWAIQLSGNINAIKGRVLSWDGSKWSYMKDGFGPQASKKYAYALPRHLVATDKNLFITGAFSTFYKDSLNFIGELKHISHLSGKVFIDNNKNCSWDPGEAVLKNRLIELQPEQEYYNTDSNGNYTIYADSGMHNVSLVSQKYWSQHCPTGKYSVLLGSDTSIQSLDFSSLPVTGVKDISIKVSGNRGFKSKAGIYQSYYVCYENVGTATLSGRIHFVHDSRTSNFVAKPVQEYYYSPEAVWKFDSLKVGEQRCIEIDLLSDTTLTTADSLQFIAYTDSLLTLSDTNPGDNVDTLWQNIVSSLDPNDKQSFPSGTTSYNTSKIDFLIRFQNTGNATASKVWVIDTIDVSTLNPASIHINSTSHSWTPEIKKDAIRLNFDNINLPDSATDEKGSHGFIRMTVNVKSGLPVGTYVRNKAYIYFDYNPPVPTNRTATRLGTPVAVEKEVKGITGLHIYPNPASSEIIIESLEKLPLRFTLVNSLGQQLKFIDLKNSEKNILDVSDYPSGLYYIFTNKGECAGIVIEHR